MAADRTEYKFEGDATDLIKALKEVTKAMEKFTGATINSEKAVTKEGKASEVSAKQNSKLNESLQKLNISFSKLATGAGALSAGLLAAGAAAFKFLQSMADAQNELTDLSAKTGVATKTLAGLRLAAKTSGQDLEGMASVLEPMIERMGQVKAWSKSAAEAFKAVGVDSVMMGDNLRSADEVLLEITKNLSEMEDPTERAAAAALAFGGAGTKLVQALGGDDLQKFVDAAEMFGMETGPRAAKAASDCEKSIALLDTAMRPFNTQVLETGTTLVNNFAIGWVYISTLLTELAKNIVPNLGNILLVFFADMNLKAVETADKLLETFMGAVHGFAKAYEYFTGDGGPAQAIKEISEKQKEAADSMRQYWQETKDAVANTSALGDAYQKAGEKARAYYELLRAEKAKTQSTGGTETPEEATPAGEVDIDLSKSGMDAPGGIVVEPEEDKNLDRIKDATRFVGLLEEQINQMSGPKGAFGSLLDVLGKVGESIISLADADFSNLSGSLDAVGKLAGGIASMLDGLIQKQLQNGEELTKKQKKRLMVLFAAQKAAAISQIIIETAVAAQKAYGMFGPPPSPVGIAAAVGVAAIGAAQVGMVASQKPKFHTGGIIPAPPGDQGIMMNALPGEAVLNREATAGLGAEGVSALNSGTAGGGAIAVSMIYKHRIFDNFVQDNISKGGPLRDAIKGGQRVGHKGR